MRACLDQTLADGSSIHHFFPSNGQNECRDEALRVTCERPVSNGSRFESRARPQLCADPEPGVGEADAVSLAGHARAWKRPEARALDLVCIPYPR